jgi:V/A-type H+-transporting ATPase subunit D
MLAGQREPLRERAATSGQELARTDAAAQTWLRRATILDGADAFAAAAADATRPVVRTHWTMLLGVRCAQPPEVLGDHDGCRPPPCGGAALAATVSAHRGAVAAAVRHAADVQALTAVDAALATTRQRVRALERRWIPRLEGALAAAEAQLAELEAADAIRRLRRAPAR